MREHLSLILCFVFSVSVFDNSVPWLFQEACTGGRSHVNWTSSGTVD